MNRKEQIFLQQMKRAEIESQQLPEPDAASQAVSWQLQDKIKQAMNNQDGFISFEHFMQMALYEPGLGYYAAGSRKFGVDGDFITAPEVSPLFGFCVANFCQQVLNNIPDGNILEFGAGSGTMAADILIELERQQALPEYYYILEVSAELQQRQQQTVQEKVPHLVNRVQWLQRLPEQEFNGVVLGNELLDAMPVHRFCIDESKIKQYLVSWSDDQSQFVTSTVDAVEDVFRQIEHCQDYLERKFVDGYESEVSLAHTGWLKSIQAVMGQGVILLIDYGYGRAEYYHPERSMGTLMCHYRHRAHPNPFKLIGLQDITAYVDFTTIAEAAVNNGMDVLGYATQAAFLLDCGLEKMMPDYEAGSIENNLKTAQQIKTLTLPGEMGERFKVMAL
ncbi:MAG: SAM-dependent methyltransferase, partial [Gammaproteobacteria bacterium]|nr:SAM-dependent methyltransferase [Gammaproteobacteria bacterium]